MKQLQNKHFHYFLFFVHDQEQLNKLDRKINIVDIGDNSL